MEKKVRVMKTKTVLILTVILGLFAYSLPLYAGDTEYHIEELTVIDIPIVGKISTRTTSYLSGCKLKETTTFKMHNMLIRMMSESAGKTRDVLLSDLCEEVQWKFDDDTQTYRSYSFAEIKAQIAEDEEDNDVQIDMESDHNDINNDPDITREILGVEKDINGFRARKVITTVSGDNQNQPVIIEEYYTTKAKALTKITATREKLVEELGNGANNIDGVPSFINHAYASIEEDEDWQRPEGEVIRFVITVVDDDFDPLFTMTYNVTTSETSRFDADHFSLK